MKSRSDFVANSSSTGFIVKAEEDTPKIFKRRKMSWEEFCSSYLFDYMLGDFAEACSSYYSLSRCYWSSEEAKEFDIRKHIKIVDDDVFVASFISMRPQQLALPRSFACIEDELCDTIMAARQVGTTYRFRHCITNGAEDYELTRSSSSFIWGIHDSLTDIVSKEILGGVYGWLKAKLDEQCKMWSFWCAELDDSDCEGGEAAGYDQLHNPAVTWHFTESHH